MYKFRMYIINIVQISENVAVDHVTRPTYLKVRSLYFGISFNIQYYKYIYGKNQHSVKCNTLATCLIVPLALNF